MGIRLKGGKAGKGRRDRLWPLIVSVGQECLLLVYKISSSSLENSCLQVHLGGSWVFAFVLSLCPGTQAFAERGVSMKEGKQLTTQLLGRRQAGRLQDELALHLSGQLLHEERLLELRWAGGVLRSLRQKGSVSEMAHFNSIRILMSYNKKTQTSG